MKPIKLTSLLLMLLVASTAFGQEVFYDDVYFSGKKEKKEQKEEKKVVEPQKQTQRTATAAQMNASTNAKAASSLSDDEIDAISGATITTNAMTNGVNAGLCAFRYVEGGAES